jgi:hypothetical protein
MFIELNYDSAEEVPEAVKALYTEKDGKMTLTGVRGMKTVQDVTNVQEALRKEREDHASVKNVLKGWGSLNPEEVLPKLDRFAELEAAAADKLDDAAINKLVEGRIGQRTAPLERKITELSEQRDATNLELLGLKGGIQTRDMNDAVRSMATEMKVLPSAIADVEIIVSSYLERDVNTGQFIVKANVAGATPGSDIRGLLKDMRNSRPHWWAPSAGGGAGGGGFNGDGGENPWSSRGWSLTAQGAFVKTHGVAKAEEAAKSANSKIGATKPTK